MTDAVSAAANASATILVVEAGRTNAAEAAIAALRKVGATVVGVVLNKAREKNAGSYYYYDYSDSGTSPRLGSDLTDVRARGLTPVAPESRSVSA